MTTQEMLIQVGAMLAKYGFVEDPERCSLNDIQMHREIGDLGYLSVWVRDWTREYEGLKLLIDQGSELTAGIVETRDLAMLETAIQQSIKFSDAIAALTPNPQYKLAPYPYAATPLAVKPAPPH